MPSKLEMLLQLVKAKKGAYGAQRVERAADEIKNLEKLYSQEALSGAFLGDNAKALMSMPTKNFERYAVPLKQSSDLKLEFVEGLPEMTRDEYIKYLSKVKGLADVPYLEIGSQAAGKTPYIAGHEGRHRMRALNQAGQESGLVVLQPRYELRETLPRRSQEEYINALRQEIGAKPVVSPELAKSASPEVRSDIELPEIYKQGGKVSQDAMHMAVMNQKVQKKSAGGDLKKALELWNIAKGTRAKAAQEAAGLYHPIGGGVKLQTPVPFMEFKTIEDPTIKKAARKIISPEQLQGGIAIPLVGDRAAAGRILTDIGGQKLARPVTLEGGPEYMLTHTQDDPSKSAIWASDKGVISGLSKQAKIAGESGRPVYGVNVIGSPTNVDYNTMTTQAFLGMLDPSSLTKKVKKEFTRELRNYVPDPKKPHNIPGKDFVGFDDIDAMREQLLAPGAGELRKAFLNRMGIDKFKGSGLPDVAHARLSVTEPSLLDEPLGSAGFTIARMDPEGKIIESPVREHGTYSTPLGGQYEGSLERVIPYKKFFPSFEERRRLFGASPAGDYRAFSLSPVSQELDQEWLDTVMKSLGKDKPSVSEFKDGGVAHMKDGDLVDELISEAKKKQEAPVNPFRMPTQKQSEYEKDFRQYLANQQAAREQVITELPQRLRRGFIPGIVGAAAGYAAQVPGAAGDIASLYQEVKPENWPNLPDVVQSLPTTERIQQYFFPEDKTSPEFQAGITGGNIAALGQGIASLPAAAKGVAKGATAGSKALANEAAYRIHQAMTKGEGPLAGALAGVAPRPLITWHGSPHRFPPTEKNPLGEFDPTKIGTGEGAQAYGHGFYTAESKNAAVRYRDTLTNFRKDHIASKLIQAGASPELANAYAEFTAKTKGGARAFDDFAAQLNEKSPSPYIEKFREKLRDELPSAKAALDAIKGSLYKVDLPDEQIAKMLDWDKPLSEQPERVKSLFSTAEGDPRRPLGQHLYKEMVKDAIMGRMGGNFSTEYEAANFISNELRKAGIPGIKYLDQASRRAGEGTRNFVVFPGNESLMNIVGREKKGGVIHKAEGGLTSDDLIVEETPL
jgi:hypothetical protein